MPESIKFGNVVLCDDIRLEVRNKISLVGMLANDVFLDQIPSIQWFAIYIEFFPAELGPLNVGVSITLGPTPVFLGRVDLNIVDLDTRGVITLPRFPVPVEQEGDFIVALDFPNERHEVLKRRFLRGEPMKWFPDPTVGQ